MGDEAALTTTLLRTSARVAGLCDAIDHLELAEVPEILAQAEALARTAVVSWADRATVEELVDDVVARAAKRRAKYAPGTWLSLPCRCCVPAPPAAGTPGRAPASPSLLRTWEDLRDHLEWSDRLSDPDFMGRARPAQLRHLSYTFPKLAAALADSTADGPADPARLASQCLMLALRVTSVCRARFDDATISRPPTVRC